MPSIRIKRQTKFNVRLPSIDIQQIMYCPDERCPLILVRPTKVSCDKIQECLYLGNYSINGLKLDTESADPKEQTILIVYREKTTDRFSDALFISSISESVDLKPIDYQLAKQSLNVYLNSGKRVISVMSKAFDNPEDSDLKFKARRKGKKRKSNEEFETIHVHKWFVKQSSEYFRRMFTNDWNERESNLIEVKDFSYEAYYEFLRYLYTDWIGTDNMDILLEMWSIGDQYTALDFKAKCTDAIKLLINNDNVCTVYTFALLFNAKQLEDFCFRRILDKNKEIVGTNDFESMDNHIAKQLLKNILENYN